MQPSTFFTSQLLNKLYWPLMAIYIIILLVLIMLYFTQINNWADRGHYNMMNFRRIGFVAILIGASLYMKFWGNIKAANMILYIPTFILLLILVLGIIIMYIFSTSITPKQHVGEIKKPKRNFIPAFGNRIWFVFFIYPL